MVTPEYGTVALPSGDSPFLPDLVAIGDRDILAAGIGSFPQIMFLPGDRPPVVPLVGEAEVVFEAVER